MQQVITSKQAKQVTGGRTPLTVESYERAVTALQETICVIDTMKWANLADAHATVAKIHRDEKALRLARILKLRAYRRMGQLAEELRPTNKKNIGGKTLAALGAVSLLREVGLTPTAARAARALGTLTEEKFATIAQRPTPPSPISAIVYATRKSGSSAWIEYAITGSRSPHGALPFCRSHPPAALARQFSEDEAALARKVAVEIMAWLDEFEQHLPKAK